ncbi:L,D-transpeptidase [Conexibacter stalactiti]|uniref:L,D-transpeptidase n=1 Tax=Conexibacter stalactiti TaxID=1940611 RepID=A0ABU4HMZ6_9ACTN|nr:L,D-transpeptidase [Conexibacter stalactiti]MDW5593419.1 L,D-transpeptidase [Conexibacter stalactiti]MEC5034060.1 L,D-transpeptidase [Conexibacter stalactiti]
MRPERISCAPDGGGAGGELGGDGNRLLLERREKPGRTWLKVRLPDRSNTAGGWIPADVARLRHTDMWVDVRTRAGTVSVYRAGQLVRRFGAVVGAPTTPTPHGLFAVLLAAPQRDPRGFIGPWRCT